MHTRHAEIRADFYDDLQADRLPEARTDPDTVLRQAVRRYIIARETPGVPSGRYYHKMRRAARQAERDAS